MREIIEYRHAAADADGLEPPLDPPEGPEALGKLRGSKPDATADRDGCQRIPDVMETEQRRLEMAERFATAAHHEPRHTIGMLNAGGLPRGLVGRAERLDRTDRVRDQTGGVRTG